MQLKVSSFLLSLFFVFSAVSHADTSPTGWRKWVGAFRLPWGTKSPACEEKSRVKPPTFKWKRGPKVESVQTAYDLAVLKAGGRYLFVRIDPMTGSGLQHPLNFENIRNVSIEKVDDAFYNVSMQVSVGDQWRAYRVFLSASGDLEVLGESLAETETETLYSEHPLPNAGGKIFLYGKGQAVVYSRYDAFGTFSTGTSSTKGLKLANSPIKEVEFDPAFMGFGLVKFWSESGNGAPLLRLYSLFENKIVFSESLVSKESVALRPLPVAPGSPHAIDQAVLFAQTTETQFKAVVMSRDSAGNIALQIGRGEFSEIGHLDFDSVKLEIDEVDLRAVHFQAALGLEGKLSQVSYALMIQKGAETNSSFSLLSHARMKARTPSLVVYEYKNPTTAELNYRVYPVNGGAKKAPTPSGIDLAKLRQLMEAGAGSMQFVITTGSGAMDPHEIRRRLVPLMMPPGLPGGGTSRGSIDGLVRSGVFGPIPPAGAGLLPDIAVPTGPLIPDPIKVDGSADLFEPGESSEDAFKRIHEGIALDDSYRGKSVKGFEFSSDEEAEFVNEEKCLELFKSPQLYAFHFKKSDSYLVVHAAKGTSFFVKDFLQAQFIRSASGRNSLFVFSKLVNHEGAATVGLIAIDLASGDVFQQRPVLKNVEFAHYGDIPSITIEKAGIEDFAGAMDTSIHLQDYFSGAQMPTFNKAADVAFWEFNDGKEKRTLVSGILSKRPFTLIATNLEKVSGAAAVQDRAYFADRLYLFNEDGGFDTGQASFLFLYPPEAKGKGKEPYLAMACPAKPTLSASKVDGSRQSYLARGSARYLGRDVDFEFNLSPLDTAVPAITYNKRQNPVFENEDFVVHVSDAFENTNPQLYVRNKKFGSDAVVYPLKFVWPDVAAGVPEQIKKILCAMFGVPYVENSPVGIEANQNVTKVELRHGRHLYVETAANAAGTNYTFVFDLATSKMVAALPNMVGEHNFGDYRFLVGQANNQSSTMIALYDTKENRVHEYFDLGRFKIDPKNPKAIEWNTQDQSIRFTSTDGMLRIFDLNLRNFRGKAPVSIQSEMDELAKEVGPVRSEIIFRQGVEPLRERDRDIGQVEKVFPFQRSVASRNLMIIGEGGSGKTHFFHDYLHRFLQGSLAHEPHYGVVVVEISREIIGSGTKYVGTFGDKFRKLQSIAERMNKKDFRLVIMLDNVEQLLGNDEEPGMEHRFAEGDVFSQLKVLMEADVLDVVATTTAGGAGLLKRKKGAFFNAFNRTMRLDSLNFEQSLLLAQDYLERKIGDNWAQFLNAQDLRGYMETASRFSARAFPGSVMQVVKAAVDEWQFDPNKAHLNSLKERIEIELAAKTGVPRVLLSRDPAVVQDFCARLEAFLLSRVKGQDKAISSMVVSLRSFALGLNRRDWPLVRVLSLGPTGVGKTALFKALREFLFTDEEAMKIIHGEYYQTADSALRLKEELVKHVRNYPFNITLFDEIEKMHPDVRSLILGLADGELTDSRGNKVFTSLTVFGATANVGSRDLFKAVQPGISLLPQDDRGSLEALARDEARLRDIFWRAAEKEFPPEQLARFDYHLVYAPLVEDIARVITRVYLNDEDLSLRRRYLDNGYDIVFDDSLVDHIVSAPEFFDYKYGARRLAIAIENFVSREFLTRQILQGQIVSGKKYRVRYDNGLKVDEIVEPAEVTTD